MNGQRGGGWDGQYGDGDGLNWWENNVVNIILGTESNSPLAYAPVLELHHIIISTLGGHGGQLERERNYYTFIFILYCFFFLFIVYIIWGLFNCLFQGIPVSFWFVFSNISVCYTFIFNVFGFSSIFIYTNLIYLIQYFLFVPYRLLFTQSSIIAVNAPSEESSITSLYVSIFFLFRYQ